MKYAFDLIDFTMMDFEDRNPILGEFFMRSIGGTKALCTEDGKLVLPSTNNYLFSSTTLHDYIPLITQAEPAYTYEIEGAISLSLSFQFTWSGGQFVGGDSAIGETQTNMYETPWRLYRDFSTSFILTTEEGESAPSVSDVCTALSDFFATQKAAFDADASAILPPDMETLTIYNNGCAYSTNDALDLPHYKVGDVWKIGVTDEGTVSSVSKITEASNTSLVAKGISFHYVGRKPGAVDKVYVKLGVKWFASDTTGTDEIMEAAMAALLAAGKVTLKLCYACYPLEKNRGTGTASLEREVTVEVPMSSQLDENEVSGSTYVELEFPGNSYCFMRAINLTSLFSGDPVALSTGDYVFFPPGYGWVAWELDFANAKVTSTAISSQEEE